ncbi:hypothetical protein [Streptomyces bullii]|uniref:Uncharacterized protein n=1 Tax=Streptomyces bullii TaxID=349910 RepID=A0ABW0UNW1_9ACTN
MSVEQLALDCEPDWTDDYEPSDRTPTRTDMRRAELADLRDQGARITQLRTAHTIPTGSYL